MGSKGFKKTIAAVMALIIIGGAMPAAVGGLIPVNTIAASAASADGSVTLKNGVLTLSGHVTYGMINEYGTNSKVTSIVASKGTVLPEGCGKLFDGLYKDPIPGTQPKDIHFANVKSIDLHLADTSNVTTMYRMFNYLKKLESVNLSGIDVSNVTNMNYLFNQCSNLTSININGWDLSGLVSAEYMFGNCESLTSIDLNGLDFSKVGMRDSMFVNCINLQTIDLGDKFQFSNVLSINWLFYGCKKLKTIFTSTDESKYPNLHYTENADYVFGGCISLVGGNGTKCDGGYVKGDSYVNVDEPGNPGYLTNNCCSFNERTGTLTLSGSVNKISLDRYRNDSRVKHIVTDGTAVLPADSSYLFSCFSSLVDVDFSSADSTNVTDIGAMFTDCTNLVTVDLTGFRTNKITSMYAAFLGCPKLKTIYVNKYWDVSGTAAQGVNSVNMFRNCTLLVGGNGTTYNSDFTDNTYARADQGTARPGYLTLVDDNYILQGTLYIKDFSTVDFSDYAEIKKISALEGSVLSNDCMDFFNADNNKQLKTVTEIDLSKASFSSDGLFLSSMFYGCSSLKKVAFPVGNRSYRAKRLSQMFDGCSSLKSVDLGFLKTSGVTDMSDMFHNCSALETVDLSSFDTSSTVYMDGMFMNCGSLTSLDLSSFNVSKADNVRNMFTNCSKLKTIYVSNLWDMSNARTIDNMFTNCTSLVGGKGTVYDRTKTDGTYARIDRRSTPGYLTNVVYEEEVEITSQPLDFEGFVGSTAYFTVEASGTKPISYQWQYDDGSGWKDCTFTGSRTSTLSVPLTAERNGMKFRCVVTNSAGPVASNEAVLSVRTAAVLKEYYKMGDTISFGNGAFCVLDEEFPAESLVWIEGDNKLTYEGYNSRFGQYGLKIGNYECWIFSENLGTPLGISVISGSGTESSPYHFDVLHDSPIAPPVITTQPVDKSGAIGSTAEFTVKATGDGLTYQWQYLKDGEWVNSNVTGSKTNTLSVAVTEGRNGLKYRCVVKDANDQETASNAATLKVTTKITKQPADFSGTIGSTAKFTVTATGAGLTYQWQYDNGSGWKNSGMTGAKTATISIPVTEARNGQKYRCVIKDANGKTVNSNAATLSVTTKIMKQPAGYSGLIGDTAKFTVTATGAGLTYQWQYLKGSDWVNSNVTGSKTNTLSVAVTEGRNGLKYRCVIKDANGKTLTSNAATLKVTSEITKQPASVSGAVGTTVKFQVTATGAGITYQWQYDNGSGWKDSGMTGNKTNTLSVPVTAARNGQKYRCIIKDANGKTLTSSAAKLIVR